MEYVCLFQKLLHALVEDGLLHNLADAYFLDLLAV